MTDTVRIIPIQQVLPHLKMFAETAGIQPPKKPAGLFARFKLWVFSKFIKLAFKYGW